MRKGYWPLSLALIVGAFAASAALYPSLPELLPTHWGLDGRPDRWTAKARAAFLMPGVMLLTAGLFRLLPWLSPKRFEVDSFRDTFEWTLALTLGLLGYIHGVMLWSGLAGAGFGERALVAGICLFFALLGNVLGKVRRNFWIGIRVPWTLANETVWINTHRFAARLYAPAGLAGFVAALCGVPFLVLMLGIVLVALVPIPYSLFEYKRLEREGRV